MRHSRTAIAAVAAVAAACGGLFGAPLATATPPANGGLVHVGQAAVIPSSLTALGAMSTSTDLQAEVVLQPSDPGALTQFVSDVSTPGSPLYHQYLPQGAFAQRFGASQATLADVSSTLRNLGLSPGKPDPDGLFVPVSGTAGTFEQALHVGLHRYRFSNGREAYANTTAPELPASIAPSVRTIVGLDDLAQPVPELEGATGTTTDSAQDSAQAVPAASGPTPCGTAPTTGSSYDAPKLAQAYSFNNLYSGNDLGAGITIGLYELERSTTSTTDTATFEACYGLTSSVTDELVDGGGTMSSSSSVGVETQLDIDTVLEMAPEASVIVYQGPNSGNGPIDTYTKMVDDDTAKVISTSWGECEYDLGETGSSGAQAESLIFEQAAAQGQTVVAASGDEGSEGCNYSGTSDRHPTTDLQVLDPASQPDVTAAGGTSLTNVATTPPTETAWTDSTGGISEFWPMPSYQSSALPSLNVINANSSGTKCGNSGGYCREVPDVSASADPNHGYLVYQHSEWLSVGGTSGAAPLWAALFALADDASACSGTTLGFVNPALYAIAESHSYSAAFNDITTGENDATGKNGGTYPAGTGYDMVTGLGSPDAAALVPLLCGPYVTSVSPTAALAGTTVTIDGANLGGATGVHFGTALANPSSISVNPAGTVLTVTAPTPVGAGPTVDITVTSGRGTSPTSATDQFTFDPPSVTSVSPTTGSAGTVVTVTGSGFSQATSVQFGSSALGTGSFTIASDNSITATAPSGPAGVVDVTVTNAAGTSATSVADHFTYPPIVTSVSPTAGISGATVTLNGSGFTTASAVHVGSTTLSVGAFTVVSDGTLTFTAPSGLSGTVPITVTDVAGTSATSAADLFTYGAPVLATVSPSAGGGGTTVTLGGSGFTNATSVQFGTDTVGAGNFTVTSDTSITVTAPTGPAGAVAVTVSNAAGTSSSEPFTYPPVVSSLSQQAGPTTGGSTITITGAGFSSVPASGAVSFGGVATTYSVLSDSTITAVVPPDSSGTVAVTVSDVGGSSPVTSAAEFSFQSTTSTTSVAPSPATPSTTPAAIGPVSASASTLTGTPRTVTANGSARATLTVTLRDASGNRIADRAVQLRALAGSSRIKPSSAVSNSSGEATFTVTDEKAQSVTYEALVSDPNLTLSQRAVVSFGAPVSARRSTLVQTGAARTSCPTGAARATLAVTLRSAGGTALSGREISLTTSRGFRGTVTPPSGLTRDGGSLSFSVSDPAKQTVRFTARDAADGVTVPGSVTVSFPAPRHC